VGVWGWFSVEAYSETKKRGDEDLLLKGLVAFLSILALRERKNFFATVT
jgi:hypothetical protein